MSLWRQLTRGLAVLVRRDRADRELDEEVAHYLDEAAAANVAAGMTPEQARRAARLASDAPLAVRETVRDQGWERFPANLLADVRFALRQLRTQPAFAITCILTLALGIGATTAIFSAAWPVLLEPLPYPRGGQIVSIADRLQDGAPMPVTYGTLLELRARSRLFESLAAMRAWQPTLAAGDRPERLEGQRVTADYFATLGIMPALGRAFTDADDQYRGPAAAILSAGLWRRRFAGDSAVIGRLVILDGAPYTVVGVMPAGFENVVAPAARVWTTLRYDPSLPLEGAEWGHNLAVIGRVRDGASVDQARRELNGIASRAVPEFARPPWAKLGAGLSIVTLKDAVTGGARPMLLAVLAAVTLLLAIAGVNVTNLLLARGARRRGEFAMRAALGASRARLAGQLLAETVVLSLAGGAAGLVLAQVGIRALVGLAGARLPRAASAGLSVPVFAFATGITLAVGIIVGLLPALDASRGEVRDLQDASRRLAGGHRFARRVLATAEVALALVLLVGTGLLLRSVRRLYAMDPGFAVDHVLTMQLSLVGPKAANDTATLAYFGQALAAVQRVPGVRAAAMTSQLPLSGEDDRYGVHFETPGAATSETGAYRYGITPDYLHVMGIPLRRGRPLTPADAAGAPIAVLLNESYARRRFPAGDALGSRLKVGPVNAPWATVVGIVGDVRQTSLASTETDAVYLPAAQWIFPDRTMWLVVRTEGDPSALAPGVEAALWSVDRDQAVSRVATLDQLVSASAADRHFALIVFELFAIAAALLAATGLYGVMAGGVAERTREIGVRAALGAAPSEILAMILGEGMVVTAAGMACGLAGAVAATRAMTSLLFEVSPLDPLTYAGVVGLLGVVAAAACWIPARRATRIDPLITLRAE